MSSGRLSGGRLSGGLMSGGLMSGGLMSGGLMSAHLGRPAGRPAVATHNAVTTTLKLHIKNKAALAFVCRLPIILISNIIDT